MKCSLCTEKALCRFVKLNHIEPMYVVSWNKNALVITKIFCRSFHWPTQWCSPVLTMTFPFTLRNEKIRQPYVQMQTSSLHTNILASTKEFKWIYASIWNEKEECSSENLLYFQQEKYTCTRVHIYTVTGRISKIWKNINKMHLSHQQQQKKEWAKFDIWSWLSVVCS